MKYTNDLTAAAAALCLATAMALLPAPATAQTVPPPGTSPQELQRQVDQMGLGGQLRQQILGSGLSPAEIRQQLASRGYDPSILDPYLDAQGQVPPPAPGDDVLSALQALNIQFRPDAAGLATTQARRDSMLRNEPILPDSTAFEEEHDLRVFGLRTFARGTSEFEPMAIGPVPPGYIIGPGDELVLVLTGDVEQGYTLPVTREGFVVIPQVGQVWVNGLTMGELRDRLFTALGRAYSGIGRGPEATTHFEVTLGRLRSNQVFLTGEVVRPGSYVTSPVASVLNALYLAGGPRPNGSFRQVRVMRGDRVAADVDLYAYLTMGRNVSDVGLQPGDVIFVPIHGPQVAVKGEVGRPAIYELRPGEDLLDLLQFAGGLTAPAALGRARITRILPGGERTQPGLDRTVVEVDLADVIRGVVPAPELRDGDELRVFRVRPEIRSVVSVSGAVWKDCAIAPRDRAAAPAEPRRAQTDRQRAADSRSTGTVDETDRELLAADTLRQAEQDHERLCTFRLEPGMRLWDAIQAAEGLKPEAYTRRAQIVRVDPADSTLTTIPVSLETDAAGIPVDNPILREFDHIRVLSRADFRHELNLAISGEVRDSAVVVDYREGLTLGDLVLEAGGLTPEADLLVEVSRRPDAAARAAGQVTETIRVPIDEAFILSGENLEFFRQNNGFPGAERPEGLAADTFALRPYDRVFVRRIPNLEDQRIVQVQGEVTYPGSYALRTKDERVSDVLERTGGLTPTAFPGGFRLYRDGELLNVDLPRLLERPGSRHDLVLMPGDRLVVPEYNPVVLVQGAVNSPTAVVYQEGASLGYYIASAGGYARHADEDRVYVQQGNGQRAVTSKVLLFRTKPEPGPGSIVTVPLIPEGDRVRFMEVVGDVAQILGTLGTALVILNRL